MLNFLKKPMSKLDNRGVSHFLVPLFVVLVVAVGGTYMLVASHADSIDPHTPVGKALPPAGPAVGTLMPNGYNFLAQYEAEKVMTKRTDNYGYPSLLKNSFLVRDDAQASARTTFISARNSTDLTYQKSFYNGTEFKLDKPELLGKTIANYTLSVKINSCGSNTIDKAWMRLYSKTGRTYQRPLVIPSTTANTQGAQYIDYSGLDSKDLSLSLYNVPEAPMQLEFGTIYTAVPAKTPGCIPSVSVDKITLYTATGQDAVVKEKVPAVTMKTTLAQGLGSLVVKPAVVKDSEASTGSAVQWFGNKNYLTTYTLSAKSPGYRVTTLTARMRNDECSDKHPAYQPSSLTVFYTTPSSKNNGTGVTHSVADFPVTNNEAYTTYQAKNVVIPANSELTIYGSNLGGYFDQSRDACADHIALDWIGYN